MRIKRTFKKIEIQGETFLYPVPVIKERKYLIQCGTETEADQLLDSFAANTLTHPDESSTDFIVVNYHSDGKTPILKLKSN